MHLLQLSDDVLQWLLDEWLMWRGAGLGTSCRRCWGLWYGRHRQMNGCWSSHHGSEQQAAAAVSLSWHRVAGCLTVPLERLAAAGLQRLSLSWRYDPAAVSPLFDLEGVAVAMRSAFRLRFFRLSLVGGKPSARDVGRCLQSLAPMSLEGLSLHVEGAGWTHRDVDAALGELQHHATRWMLAWLSIDLNSNPLGTHGIIRLCEALRGMLQLLQQDGSSLRSLSLVLWGTDPTDLPTALDALASVIYVAARTVRQWKVDLAFWLDRILSVTAAADGLAGLLGAFASALPHRSLILCLAGGRRLPTRLLSVLGEGLPVAFSASCRDLCLDLSGLRLTDHALAIHLLDPWLREGCFPVLERLTLWLAGSDVGNQTSHRLSRLAVRLRALHLRLQGRCVPHWMPHRETLGIPLDEGGVPYRQMSDLHLNLSGASHLKAQGYLRQMRLILEGTHSLQWLHLGLRNTGMENVEWQSLCAGLARLPRLRTLYLDVTHNFVTLAGQGLQALCSETGCPRLNDLTLILDRNRSTTDGHDLVDALVTLSQRPRMCRMRASLRECGLGYDATLKLVEASRPNRQRPCLITLML